MAKPLLKLKARELRNRGESIKDIAHKLNVSQSTASLWCRNIKLTRKQVRELMFKKWNAIRAGQINGSFIQKQKRLNKVLEYEKQGAKDLSLLSKKEYFIAGLALYLGEGAKKTRIIDFTNSDPKIIKFMMRWFVTFFGVRKKDFVCSVLINKIHKYRDIKVKNFWSAYLKIPFTQLRKTIFVKSRQKKIYENHDSYFGTLRLRILKSTDLSYKMLGLLKAMLEAKLPKPA